MPSPHGKIVVSTWVPDAIKKWALDEIGGSFCNEKEKETGPQLGLLRPFIEVKRHTTRDHVRAYVLQLAKACKALFDSPLYSTIATTASVALNTRVDAAFVRHVVRSHSP
jgi:hypothetical protein